MSLVWQQSDMKECGSELESAVFGIRPFCPRRPLPLSDLPSNPISELSRCFWSFAPGQRSFFTLFSLFYNHIYRNMTFGSRASASQGLRDLMFERRRLRSPFCPSLPRGSTFRVLGTLQAPPLSLRGSHRNTLFSLVAHMYLSHLASSNLVRKVDVENPFSEL